MSEKRGRKNVRRQGMVPPQAPMKRIKACPDCGGYGENYAYHTESCVICPRCGGTGEIEEVGNE